ncbi:MAG: ribonuclease HII [Rhodospirillaceae bacterium]|nr:MAG: ribonuclease HII [Rhodospirillaceae bacterium]
MPDFSLEESLGLSTSAVIVGVDEVGRGPLAGPVTAAAVFFDRQKITSDLLTKIDDSKKIAQKKRATISKQIESIAIIGIGWASSGEIDQLNILEATMLAMQRAIFSLQKQIILDPDYILIDGNKVPRLDFPSKAIVRGDEKSLSIAAASIVAKSKRDAFMTSLSKLYPGYGWEKNAGYGTREHLAAIEREGITVHHRRSFKPIANYL